MVSFKTIGVTLKWVGTLFRSVRGCNASVTTALTPRWRWRFVESYSNQLPTATEEYLKTNKGKKWQEPYWSIFGYWFQPKRHLALLSIRFCSSLLHLADTHWFSQPSPTFFMISEETLIDASLYILEINQMQKFPRKIVKHRKNILYYEHLMVHHILLVIIKI